mgnify:CR=1 FL=1
MIKLEDLLSVTYSTIAIMDSTLETMNSMFETMIINVNLVDTSYLSKTLLDSEVERIDGKDGYIRVWLKEEEKGWALI